MGKAPTTPPDGRKPPQAAARVRVAGGDERRERAAECFADGKSNTDTAEIVGANRHSVAAWRDEPGVKARVAEIQEARRTGAVRRLHAATDAAVALLELAMGTEAAGWAVRVKAATEILDRVGVTTTTTVEHVETATPLTVEQRVERILKVVGGHDP